ncbi:MAG: Gfo/Idh/MocA family oxidoreductase [Candidatus Hydrogenedentes bacterium]|nr:Gfo/Idh/MocA family oxidoreductase [Candidatus Hydrogenedentota bacterium]
MMRTMSRRLWLKTAAVLAGAAAAPRAATANGRVVMGIMGIKDRGWDLTLEFGRRDDVEIRYLADPDSRLFEERARKVEQLKGKRPQCVQDFRRMLDDKEVDAIAIATPDHWHALGTILACQAGKDVYVEKPASHNIWEGRKMVEAARKYDRVVQVGTQNRSAEYVMKALEYVRSDQFGPVHFVRVVNSKLREPMKVEQDSETPPGVDYDMWLGPAPLRKFNLNHFHYQWHWFWNYGGGDLANDGVHQIDLARWAINRTLPKAVTSTGAIYSLNDTRETPDTQTVTWEFDGVTVALEQVLWTPYMRKTPLELRDTGAAPNWPFNGTRVEIYGEKRFMYLGRMGDGWAVYDEEGKQLFDERGTYRATGTAHAANFIDCVKSRERPNADIEDGHFSTLLAHYGNAAYRTGRRLHIDARTEGFLNDNEANGLYRRNYREPWNLPVRL